MSDRDSGIGPFLLGIAVGAVLGVLFAPERGDRTRRQLGRKFGELRDSAERQAEALVERVAEVGQDDADEDDDESGNGGGARAELERRLASARRRRRLDRAARGRTAAAEDEEDEPVA